jgi:hypothetical protein
VGAFSSQMAKMTQHLDILSTSPHDMYVQISICMSGHRFAHRPIMMIQHWYIEK